VEPFADGTDLLNQPVLDRRMHILVLRRHLQPARFDFAKREAESRTQPLVLALAEELRGLEPLDVAQAAQDVPRDQPSIPEPVLRRGVIEHMAVERVAGGPQRRGHRGGR
jgi:hypothetical protein